MVDGLDGHGFCKESLRSIHLLAINPFHDHPPRYIQATFWEYHFTDFKTKGLMVLGGIEK